MADLTEGAAGISQSKTTTNPERSYYQDIQNSYQHQLETHMAARKAFQVLREHHEHVQALYQALAHAMHIGQNRDQIWREYHQALIEHRQLLHQYLRTIDEHLRQIGYSPVQETEE